MTNKTLNNFINRKAEIKKLKSFVRGKLGINIVFLTAEQGMGKTALLSKFASICKKDGLKVIRIDLKHMEESNSHLAIMNAIQVQFGKHMRTLHIAMKDIHQVQITFNAENTPEKHLQELTKIEIGGNVTRSKIAGRDIYDISVSNHRSIQWEQAILISALIEDLRRLSQKQSIIFMIDDWQTGNREIQILLQAALINPSNLNTVLNGKVYIIVAGNTVPDIVEAVERIALLPLVTADVLAFWRLYPKLKPPSEQLMKLLQQKPHYMRIIASALNTRNTNQILKKQIKTANDFESALNILLDHVIPNKENAILDISAEVAIGIRRAAIPQRFNQSLLQVIGVEFQDVIKILDEWDLVEDASHGEFQLRDEVRRALLAWWLKPENVETFGRLNELVANYYSKLHSEANKNQNTELERISVYRREFIYHGLVRDNYTHSIEALRELVLDFEDLLNRREFTEVRTLLLAMPFLIDYKLGSDLTLSWLSYLQARQKLTEIHNGDLRQPLLKSLHKIHSEKRKDGIPYLDDVLRSAAGWYLGVDKFGQLQWREAKELFQRSLKYLPKDLEQTLQYDIRIQISLGNLYHNLINQLGRLQISDENNWWFFNLLLIPLYCYRWLVRRLGIFPVWYSDLNYQSWIVAGFLSRAHYWFQKAEAHVTNVDKFYYQVEVKLRIAQIYHYLEQWKKAWEIHPDLEDDSTITHGSFYRQAICNLSYASLLMREERADEAIAKLNDIDTMVDDREVHAATYALLGRAHSSEKLQNYKIALDYFMQCIDCLQDINPLSQCQYVWELELLTNRKNFPLELKNEANKVIAGLKEWVYVAHFPNQFRRQFTRLALRALIITYVILGAILLWVAGVSYPIIMGGFSGLTPLDTIILLLNAVVPLVALWVYTIVYAIFGAFSVRRIVQTLINIGGEHPDIYRLQPDGLIIEAQGELTHIKWTEIKLCIQSDYYLLRKTHPISLISRMIIIDNHGRLCEIQGVTVGYTHLQQRLRALWSSAINNATVPIEQHNVHLLRSLLIMGSIVLLISLFLFQQGNQGFQITEPNGDITNSDETAFFLTFVLAYFLILPIIVIGHVTLHRYRMRHLKSVALPSNIISTRTLWFRAIAAIIIFAIIILLVFILLGAGIEIE